jgi:hypothetical protein
MDDSGQHDSGELNMSPEISSDVFGAGDGKTFYEDPFQTTGWNPTLHGYELRWERNRNMQGDIKRALAWGFGLGIGFAVAGMALGLFKRVR